MFTHTALVKVVLLATCMFSTYASRNSNPQKLDPANCALAQMRDMCQVPLGTISTEITADSVRSTIFSAKRRLDDAMHLLDQVCRNKRRLSVLAAFRSTENVARY